jgi:hypothetical protein
VFWSLATPLTNEHYINATQGNLYGIEKSRKEDASQWPPELRERIQCG